MAILEQLVRDMNKDPTVIHKIEEEVNRLAKLNDCSELIPISASKIPGVHIFLCKILELRIKRKLTTLNLQDEILFTTQLIKTKPSYHSIEIFSLLGLYCWPAIFPRFMDEVILLFEHNTGYQILLSFLEKINYNTTIDENRRSELKRAIALVYCHIEKQYKEEYAQLIIQIYTELLKILPKTFEYSLVFEKAREYPNEVLIFLIEAVGFIDKDKVVETLSFLKTDPGMIQTLSYFKLNKLSSPNKVYEYAFRCIEDPDSFLATIDFWQRIFSSSTHENILEPVLNKIIEVYLTIEDEELKEEVDQHIFGFFTIITKNYPSQIREYLKSVGDILPIKIATNFIQKLSKNENSKIFLSGLSFKNAYLECLVNFMRRDPKTPQMIPQLNFMNKDDVKIALLIISEFNFSVEELNVCENACLNANELKVECYIKLNINESFDGPWNMDKIIKYFYYLKKRPEVYMKYKDQFYSIFIENSPFDRCFAIVEKLGSVPDFILQNIYDKMDKYPFIDLACFNNDLLPFLPNPKPFIEKEIYRLVIDWNVIVDHKDYYLVVSSLLSIFSSKLDTYGTDLIDYMIELIRIDSPIVINKVLSVFNNYKGSYNTKKALYYLICAYNSPNLYNSQALISNSITNCLYQADGAQAFNEILGISIDRCCEAKQQICKTNKKSACNLVKDLIKDFKGKSYHQLFKDEFKVTKQNFLPSKENKQLEDYSLPQTDFF